MKRLECLDGLRGVLAVYVMISHMAPFAMLPSWLLHPFSHGGAAVDVFFILSGLVIVGSLRNHGFRAAPFLIARVARIYPVFLVVFAFASLAHVVPPALDGMTWLPPDSLAYRMWARDWPTHWPVDVLAHLTMTHGLFPNGTYPHIWISILGASWSLSTEWQFYVLALGLCMVLVRRAAPVWWLACALTLIGAAGLAWAKMAPDSWGFSRAFLGNKAAYFALGVVSVRLVTDRIKPEAVLQYLAILAAVLVICWGHGGAGKLAAPLVWTLCLSAQIAPTRPLLGTVAATLRSRPLQWLGLVSYGIYLVNEPVQRVVGSLLVPVTGGDGAAFTALWIPLAILLPVLAAAALYRLAEEPGQRWGRAVARRWHTREQSHDLPAGVRNTS